MLNKGYILVFCLLILALCSALALSALQLSRLSTLYNEALLQQQQPERIQHGVFRPIPQPVACQTTGQVWPASWQACQQLAGSQLDAVGKESGFVLETRNITIPQGGGL